MEDKVTAILRLKHPYDADPDNALRELAQFFLDTFGEGGRPDEVCLENRCGYANTPIHPEANGYVRISIGKAYGNALEFISANYENPIADLIIVEWQGQDMVDSGEVDEAGQPIYEEMLFQTGTYTDEFNNEHPVYLGRF